MNTLTKVVTIGLSFVSWHQTQGFLSGGWAFNQNLVNLDSMQMFDEHVSGQPLIRKQLDLDHRYMGRFNFVRWHHTSRSFPMGGARGHNCVHFKHKYDVSVLHEYT